MRVRAGHGIEQESGMGADKRDLGAWQNEFSDGLDMCRRKGSPVLPLAIHRVCEWVEGVGHRSDQEGGMIVNRRGGMSVQKKGA